MLIIDVFNGDKGYILNTLILIKKRIASIDWNIKLEKNKDERTTMVTVAQPSKNLK